MHIWDGLICVSSFIFCYFTLLFITKSCILLSPFIYIRTHFAVLTVTGREEVLVQLLNIFLWVQFIPFTPPDFYFRNIIISYISSWLVGDRNILFLFGAASSILLMLLHLNFLPNSGPILNLYFYLSVCQQVIYNNT